MRFLPAGDRSVLIEIDGPDALAQVHRLHRAVTASGLATDAVLGWSTLMVTADAPVSELIAAVSSLSLDETAPREPGHHEVAVRYDGEDLDEVARTVGLSVAEVIELHSSATYVVAFLGFSRAFPYLAGLPVELRLPRRATPRTRVPRGSVAIAHDQCGVYPADSPGGWNLLGTTSESFFDEHQVPPSRLAPGDTLRFVPEVGA